MSGLNTKLADLQISDFHAPECCFLCVCVCVFLWGFCCLFLFFGKITLMLLFCMVLHSGIHSVKRNCSSDPLMHLKYKQIWGFCRRQIVTLMIWICGIRACADRKYVRLGTVLTNHEITDNDMLTGNVWDWGQCSQKICEMGHSADRRYVRLVIALTENLWDGKKYPRLGTVWQKISKIRDSAHRIYVRQGIVSAESTWDWG